MVKRKKKVIIVFGTRPEAIKMCPLVNELKICSGFDVKVCVTGQHRQMLEQVLKIFNVSPDYDLSIMKEKQSLFHITTEILNKLHIILMKENPDIVLVHGDTTTAFSAALASFYLGIPIGHVEAGLRTYNSISPFPEEFNRQSIGIVANYHFAPTDSAKNNLLREGKKRGSIFVTGNTVIDAIKTTVRKDYSHPELEWASESKLVLLTAHRRENIGEPLYNMFNAIKKITYEYNNVKVIYPIHMNPLVRQIAKDILGNSDRIHIIEPLDVFDFHNFLAKCYIVLTDSGGIQEEAPALGKPVLVLRETTERPEGLQAGTLKLVGTNEESIYHEFKNLIENKSEYLRMAQAVNPYGDGNACKRIANILNRI